MTSLAEAIAALEPMEGGWRGAVPENWLQGRTAYGGFSSALALTAAHRVAPDLPPLRSAQIAFVGPLSGTVTVSAALLRRGRNAAFITAEVTSEAGLGLRATFVFMREIESAHRHHAIATPDFARPSPGDRTYGGNGPIAFIRNFELLDRREGIGAAEWLRWVRLVEREGLHPEVELIAIADCLPPAALKLIRQPVPLSSMTWQLDLTTAAPATDDGWWLLRAETGHLASGSSTQAMAIWNADGMSVAQQIQSVAIFG